MAKLGKKSHWGNMPEVSSTAKEHFPSLRVNSKQFPHLLKGGVNKKVKMTISGKTKSITPSYESPGTHDIELDVTHAVHKKSGWKKHIEA